MSKMTLYFLEKHLEDGLDAEELNLLAKSSSIYHQMLFPVQVQSNNSVMYGFIPESLAERCDFREEDFQAFLVKIMDENVAPGKFQYKDLAEIVVERFGKDLLADKLFLFDRMFRNTCGFTTKMMYAAGDALKDPELLAEFNENDLMQIDSLGRSFVMTRDAYEAAAFHHELKDAAEMARTAIIAYVFQLESIFNAKDASHIEYQAIPEDEAEIRKVLEKFYISEEKLNEMISEVSQQFVGNHDSDISDNEQIQSLVEDVVTSHTEYVDNCMAEGTEPDM